MNHRPLLPYPGILCGPREDLDRYYANAANKIRPDTAPLVGTELPLPHLPSSLSKAQYKAHLQQSLTGNSDLYSADSSVILKLTMGEENDEQKLRGVQKHSSITSYLSQFNPTPHARPSPKKKNLLESSSTGFEIAAWMRRRGQLIKRYVSPSTLSDLRTTFNNIDLDGSGEISLGELVHVFNIMGFDYSQSEVVEMMQACCNSADSADAEGLSFDKFCVLMTEHQNHQLRSRVGKPRPEGEMFMNFPILARIHRHRKLIDTTVESSVDPQIVHCSPYQPEPHSPVEYAPTLTEISRMNAERYWATTPVKDLDADARKFKGRPAPKYVSQPPLTGTRPNTASFAPTKPRPFRLGAERAKKRRPATQQSSSSGRDDHGRTPGLSRTSMSAASLSVPPTPMGGSSRAGLAGAVSAPPPSTANRGVGSSGVPTPLASGHKLSGASPAGSAAPTPLAGSRGLLGGSPLDAATPTPQPGSRGLASAGASAASSAAPTPHTGGHKLPGAAPLDGATPTPQPGSRGAEGGQTLASPQTESNNSSGNNSTADAAAGDKHRRRPPPISEKAEGEGTHVAPSPPPPH